MMNDLECANCVVYGWKQVEDKTSLQKCKNCQLIFYCSKECQAEHWKKVHKRHCKYFADPSNASQWPHKAQNCSACAREPSRNDSRRKRADNPSYYCVQRILNMCTLRQDLHPHPFPVVGYEDDIVEKAVIVLHKLVFKFEMLELSTGCEELMELCFLLACNTIRIWRKRKTYPQPRVQIYRRMVDDVGGLLSRVQDRSKQFKPKDDPFQLWKIILQVHEMFKRLTFFRGFSVLKDHLVNLHADFHKVVKQGVKNSANFLSVANRVLDALATRVIPYEEVLKMICGGSLKQNCTFCTLEIVITGVVFHGSISTEQHARPEAFFDPMFVGIYHCGGEECRDKLISLKVDFDRFVVAVTTIVKEREGNRCDFCFRLPPTNQVHRCGLCRTKMYCCVNCLNQDWHIHKLGCAKQEERKIKAGSSVRRKQAMKAKCKQLDKFANMHVDSPVDVQQGVCDVLNKLKYPII